MSLEKTVWAYEQHIGSSSAKFLLVVLADSSSPASVCSQNMESLCRKLDQTKDEIVFNLEYLEGMGFLGSQDWAQSTKRSWFYVTLNTGLV